MRVRVRKIGNSHGVIIPLGMLAMAGIGDEADMNVVKHTLVLRNPPEESRAGWAAASKAIAAAGGGGSAWPAFVHDDTAATQREA